MLEFQRHLPSGAGDGSPVAVLLHGRGSHMGDLQALRDHLPDGMALLTPQAPHPGLPWGYGMGWAWYRHLGGDRVDASTLDRSIEALDGFLTALPDHLGFEPGPLVLGGFSQGGTVSLVYSLRRPGAVAAALVFSGFLANPDLLEPPQSGVGGTPVFWGHGMEDPMIPLALAEPGRQRLREGGAELTARDYPIGHWIAPEEISDAKEYLETQLEQLGGSS